MKQNLDNIVKAHRKTLVVGVDVDNTLFNIPVIEHVNKKFGTKYTDEDVKDFGYSNFPALIRAEIMEKFVDPEFMCRVHPEWGTYGRLRDWCVEGVRLFAITRRDYSLIRATNTMISRELPGLFEDVFYVRPNESKVKYLRHIGATHHIDDYDVEDSVKAGIQTWLIANKTTTYNSHLRANTNLYQAEAIQYVKLEHDKWNT